MFITDCDLINLKSTLYEVVPYIWHFGPLVLLKFLLYTYYIVLPSIKFDFIQQFKKHSLFENDLRKVWLKLDNLFKLF